MKRILTVDTTGAYCAACVTDGADLRAGRAQEMLRGQAEHLLPMCEDALQEAGMALGDLDALAVATGPGNFTGVRISVAFIRGLALSLGIPAIGVSVLEALAHGTDAPTLCCLDARGGAIYAQIFEGGTPQAEARILQPEDLAAEGFSVTAVRGFRAEEFARALGARHYDEARPSTETFARIALARDWTAEPRPVPLYIRQPDAALPSEPPPVIVP